MSNSPPSVAATDSVSAARVAAIKQEAQREFDRWSASYDRSWLNPFVFFPCIRACLEELLRWQAGRNGAAYDCVDVGCGTASLLVEIARQSPARNLVGVDYSPAMVARAQDKLRQLSLSERVNIVHGDAEHLPFPEASFDVLTCCNSFHHYPRQAAVVAEFRRVLRPGGLFVLIDGFRDNVVGWVLFDVFVVFVEKDVHHASWSEMRRMIDDAGLQNLRQRKMNVLAPLLVNVAQR